MKNSICVTIRKDIFADRSFRFREYRQNVKTGTAQADPYRQAYQRIKRLSHIAQQSHPPALPLGKRHNGESLEYFKQRRKVCNARRRAREKQITPPVEGVSLCVL